ncbi:MAG: hypothetical protein ACYTG4_05660, partial [Planctomycetota bacterium]
LFKALDEEDPEVLRAAVSGIALITGKRFVGDPEAPIPESEREEVRRQYRTWWKDHPTAHYWKRKACAAIGDAGMRRLALYMIPWMGHEDERLRKAALDGMRRLADDETWSTVPVGTAEEQADAMERARAWIAKPSRGGGR